MRISTQWDPVPLGHATHQSGARVEIGAPGVQVTVIVPSAREGTLVSGVSAVDTQAPVVASDRFRIGSITKTYVAAVALELAEEGALDLDAPVAAVRPDLPFADQMTLRQNLAHTAGWDDYAYSPEFLSSLTDAHAPEALIGFVSDALLFEPGTDFAYSNASFVVVGLAIEAVTGADYGAEVHRRLLDPLRLGDTFVPTLDGEPAGLVRGYLGTASEGYLDVTDQMDASGPWASGEIVATSAAVARWGRALYGGDVLSGASQGEVTGEVVLPDGRGTGYGLGTYLDPVGDLESVGHSGSTMGFQSRLRAVRRGDDVWVVATMVNDVVTAADAVDAAVWEVLAASDPDLR